MIRVILEQPDTERFRLEVNGRDATVLNRELNHAAIYGLESALDPDDLKDGVQADIDPALLSDPLAFELALHAAYLHVVHHFLPRHEQRMAELNDTGPHCHARTLNRLRNMARPLPHVETLRGAAQGSALLLCTPGPSLDPDYVAGMRGQALVLAVGLAITTLTRAGIAPDICWIQDQRPASWENILDGLDPEALREAVLVVDPEGPVAQYADRFKAVYRAWNSQPFESDGHPDLEEIPASSSTGGYSLARLLGADPVLVLGCDCGFPLEPARAKGLGQYDSNLSDPGLFRVDGVAAEYKRAILLRHGGLAVRTRSSYLACAQWFKSRAYRHKMEQGLELYSRSATGMLRFHSTIRPVEELPVLPQGKGLRLPEAQARDTRPHIFRLLQEFRDVDQALRPGQVLPDNLKQPPFQCLFDHAARNGEPLVLNQDQYDTARHRLHQVLSALDQTLNQTS